MSTCPQPRSLSRFSSSTFSRPSYYLWKRSAKADALAATTAEVGVVFCSVVLITGPIWARYAWGVWWSPWDMRLNTTLMLWLLYVSYLMMRRSSTAGSTSVLAAALAVFSFLDVPIVYMANRWFRTHHPAPMLFTPNIDHRMQNIMFINMLAFLCFSGLICWFRYEMERTAQKIDAAHIQQAAGGAAGMMLIRQCSSWLPAMSRRFHISGQATWRRGEFT